MDVNSLKLRLDDERKKWDVSDEKIVTLNEQIIEAVEENDFETVSNLLDTQWNNISLTHALNSACENKCRNIVEYLISKGARSWQQAFDNACRSGDVNLVEFIVSKEEEELKTRVVSDEFPNEYQMIDFDYRVGRHVNGCGGTGFDEAVFYGHKDVVEYLLSRPSEDHCIDLEGACLVGRRDIIDKLIDQGANNWNDGLRGACSGNHINIVNYMIDKGANDWNAGLRKACSGNHIHIVKYMIEKGANDWNGGLFKARSYDIMRLMISYGANNFNDALPYICLRILRGITVADDFKSLQLLVDSGADDVRPLLYCNYFDFAVIIINRHPDLVTDDTVFNNESFSNFCELEETMHLLNRGANNLNTTHSLHLHKIRNEICQNFKTCLDSLLCGISTYYDFHCLEIMCSYIEFTI